MSLLRLITRLGFVSRRPWTHLLRAVLAFARRLATHPQVAELLRFIFLGTIVETGRQMAAKIAEFAADCESVKAEFPMGDFAYDWIVHYLEHHRVWNESRSFKVVARNAASRPAHSVKKVDGPTDHPIPIYEPATAQSSSFFRWRGYWMSIVRARKYPSLRAFTNLFARLHSSDKQVLADLIECAKQRYVEAGASRVTVHLTSTNGHWAKTVTKSRRALSTLILPSDIKEAILADAREFLDNEEWYKMTGIPHRRGRYGAPGTGKSSTVHAIAGELGLEIYFISLANPGIDDYTLAQLIGDTPARCILLIEDIDCAFPSRDDLDDDDDDEHQKKDHYRRAVVTAPPKSAVTLSGLLNVLDSVSSEEGRITFATTNHIANLDAALIRPGRMDVKIKYGLATTEQIEQVFKVFFPAVAAQDTDTAALARHAAAFAAAIPTETYSIAQIQGYLLTKKHDPAGALQGARAWLVAQQEERRALLDAKQQRRAEIARWQRGVDEAYMRGVDAWERVVGEGEAPQAPPTPATSAGSPVDRGAPRDLLVMGEGEAPREPATGSGSPVDRGAPRDIVDLLMVGEGEALRGPAAGPGSPVDGGAPGDIVTSDLLVQQQGNVDSAE
ncbi:P-loop containing nucleoside triphosphate hydrolase protein [Mycena pura]|uniref:P-loop containing nucleoside triphosphate hydrolase protein n=1 Tax=Mycena pura TaxID=153505 RepID=A0AAD6UU31_9AGAR|nr:P-loop containing nucleoside triphosphate hydrolase protein [Mycena pura]